MIYISSSWKNRKSVRWLAIALRTRGFEVFDFTDPDCRETECIPPERFLESFDPKKHNYMTYLDRPEWNRAVKENKQRIGESSLVILLLPCGIDATADWAFAVGRGISTLIVGEPVAGERSPVHLWADDMVLTLFEAINWICNKRKAQKDYKIPD